MAEKCFPLEATDYTAKDAQLWFATRTSGVYAGQHLAVTANGSMGLMLGPGIAWLHYDPFAGCVYANTDNKALTVPMSDAQYDRIDRVCVRLDILTNTFAAYVKKGTAAASPVPPELQRDNVAYEISVAQVRVGVGVTEINAVNITDERLDADACGLMSDGVTGIDTSVIEAQVQALIAQLQSELQAVYNGVEKVNVAEQVVTLAADGWSAAEPYTQTVAAQGVLASDAVIVTPAPANHTAYGEAGVYCSAQGTENLTFTCSTVPEAALAVNVMVIR